MLLNRTFPKVRSTNRLMLLCIGGSDLLISAIECIFFAKACNCSFKRKTTATEFAPLTLRIDEQLLVYREI